MIKAFFEKYLMLFRIAGVVVVIIALWAAYHAVDTRLRDHYQAPVKEQLQQSQADLSTCQGNTKTLRDSLDTQNKAIETLERNAKLQADALQKAQAKAKTLIVNGKADALAIEQLKLTGNCEQDMDTLARAVK